MNKFQDKIEKLKQDINSGRVLPATQKNQLEESIREDVTHAYLLLDILNHHTEASSMQTFDVLIYEVLLRSKHEKIIQAIKEKFPNGVVNLQSDQDMNYSDLQELLVNENFLEADKLTQQKLFELAKLETSKRKWLYFTDISLLPSRDLLTIDNLWRTYSLNRFGFSIQRQIWLSVKCNLSDLLEQIQWTVDNNLCRYPDHFTWDLTAPRGHLPLFNQLRGSQTLISLLSHKAWE